jgi:hypothetical protein
LSTCISIENTANRELQSSPVNSFDNEVVSIYMSPEELLRRFMEFGIWPGFLRLLRADGQEKRKRRRWGTASVVNQFEVTSGMVAFLSALERAEANPDDTEDWGRLNVALIQLAGVLKEEIVKNYPRPSGTFLSSHSLITPKTS